LRAGNGVGPAVRKAAEGGDRGCAAGMAETDLRRFCLVADAP